MESFGIKHAPDNAPIECFPAFWKVAIQLLLEDAPNECDFVFDGLAGRPSILNFGPWEKRSTTPRAATLLGGRVTQARMSAEAKPSDVHPPISVSKVRWRIS